MRLLPQQSTLYKELPLRQALCVSTRAVSIRLIDALYRSKALEGVYLQQERLSPKLLSLSQFEQGVRP